jgi:alpha-galactosidase
MLAAKGVDILRNTLTVAVAAIVFAGACSVAHASEAGKSLTISIDPKGCGYSVSAPGISGAVLRAQPAVKVDGKWIYGRDYPSCKIEHSQVSGELGAADEWNVRYSGIKDAPELLLRVRSYTTRPFGELQLTGRNTSSLTFHIESFRLVDADGTEVIHLGGSPSSDRVLSDSFSEDRPGMQLHDLSGATNGMHRAVGVQLIYNRQSRQSWFIGALTSDKFLSVLRLHMASDHTSDTTSYEVDSTGTTELLEENSLQDSPAADRVELSLPVSAGAELSSERMLFSISDDYHRQLETYGELIREMHHARISAPAALGWWSWTAYYFGLNEGTALTNSEWLAQHLKPLGFTFFHIDEGYQYARGEYATPDAVLFPSGVAALERKVAAQGLTPGIWTAPFQVSERSWVYEHHPEWLVHNPTGKPIRLGLVAENKDQLYALDTTNPEAQAYLTRTYSTLAHEWGIRYIKMDFMEDSAVEGYYHVPNTTALEAQRIGIRTIREAVGNDVLLDKDGCELLNPVGLVDMGRISQDTGHTFGATKDAEPGVAARYYMNRNYFISDPDAFTVSRQTVDDQSWHGDQQPLTLDEAKVSIALTAVSGGMFEIGDDLPTLGEDPDRVALVENRDLIDMARLGKASTPLDLMNYASADAQPSLFLLHEDRRQLIVTLFNWTESPRNHTISRAELGLDANRTYAVRDILTPDDQPRTLGAALELSQPRHSVRMIKIVDTRVPGAPPGIVAMVPPTGMAGETLNFSAQRKDQNQPVLQVTWKFGDGVEAADVRTDGFKADHAYTHAGSYTVHAQAVGLGGVVNDQSFPIVISGAVTTKFVPEEKQRLSDGKP